MIDEVSIRCIHMLGVIWLIRLTMLGTSKIHDLDDYVHHLQCVCVYVQCTTRVRAQLHVAKLTVLM